jgi:hypothetical protein
MSVPNLKREEAAMAQKCIRTLFVSIAFLVLMPLLALAQTPFAPPPQIPYGLSVSTESAKNVAAAAIAEAQKNNWKMAIAIVDTGGYLVYFEKMQDTQTGSVELAIEKARTASALPASHESIPGRRSRWRRGSPPVTSHRRHSD